MKTLKLFILSVFFIGFTQINNAQTVDEIITNYFEATGGVDNWKKVESLKYEGIAEVQGMQIPWVMVQTKDGKQALTIDIQGQKMTQYAFDGETMWTTNFMTMQPEKSDSENTENMKKSSAKSFPSPFLDYKAKGYTAELVGEETIEGTATYKVKLTQDPVMVDGVETPNVTYYYFDKDTFAAIATEAEVKQGPMKGQTFKDSMSDYQEVNGLYFPFAMTQGGQGMNVKTIEVNPEIDASVFMFPETASEKK